MEKHVWRVALVVASVALLLYSQTRHEQQIAKTSLSRSQTTWTAQHITKFQVNHRQRFVPDPHTSRSDRHWQCPLSGNPWLCREARYWHRSSRRIGELVFQFVGVGRQIVDDSFGDNNRLRSGCRPLFSECVRECALSEDECWFCRHWQQRLTVSDHIGEVEFGGEVASRGGEVGSVGDERSVSPIGDDAGSTSPGDYDAGSPSPVGGEAGSGGSNVASSDVAEVEFKARPSVLHESGRANTSTHPPFDANTETSKRFTWPVRSLDLVVEILFALDHDPGTLLSLLGPRQAKRNVVGKDALHVAYEAMRRNANATQDDVRLGGGGGAGIQVICDDTTRLSIGAGGGAGIQVSNKTTRSAGGGFGGGIQIFDEQGGRVMSLGGGGGGGITIGVFPDSPEKKPTHSADGNQSATTSVLIHQGLTEDDRLHPLPGVTVESGSSADEDSFLVWKSFNQSGPTLFQHPHKVKQAIRDLVGHLKSDLRTCAHRGKLVVFGGGGAGGGMDASMDGVQQQSGGEIGLRMQYVPCDAQTPPSVETPNGGMCVYNETGALFARCQDSCVTASSYLSCVCPCAKAGFADELNCSWAQRMTCSDSRT